MLGNLADPAIDESSGLVASRTSPGRYWTHNDSGADPLLYCVGGSGESCGVWRVTGAQARDWEDIAAGPGPGVEGGARPHLYVGDIGDNQGELDEVVVYRVLEPDVTASTARGAAVPQTEPAEAVRLQYPDGPHDAEALLVHPVTGDLYIVTKESAPTVYVARAPLDPRQLITLQRLTVLTLDAAADDDAVTGGDIAPDGRRLALCTYLQGYEFELHPDEIAFDAIWQQPPSSVALGGRAQGEAIAYRLDSNALLTTSERALGLAAPLQQVERL